VEKCATLKSLKIYNVDLHIRTLNEQKQTRVAKLIEENNQLEALAVKGLRQGGPPNQNPLGNKSQNNSNNNKTHKSGYSSEEKHCGICEKSGRSRTDHFESRCYFNPGNPYNTLKKKTTISKSRITFN